MGRSIFFQETQCWRHFKSATEAIRQQEVSFETKNLEFVKAQKWSKQKNLQVGPTIFSSPDFGKGKPEQPEVMAVRWGKL